MGLSRLRSICFTYWILHNHKTTYISVYIIFLILHVSRDRLSFTTVSSAERRQASCWLSTIPAFCSLSSLRCLLSGAPENYRHWDTCLLSSLRWLLSGSAPENYRDSAIPDSFTQIFGRSSDHVVPGGLETLFASQYISTSLTLQLTNLRVSKVDNGSTWMKKVDISCRDRTRYTYCSKL